MKQLLISLAFFLIGICAHSEPFDASVAAEIERFQADFGKLPNAHGGVVIGLIDETGTRIFVVESGSAKGEMNGDTVFELGSVTKVFTTLIAFELERSEIWNLHDPVENHVPSDWSIPSFGGEKIRLENLTRQDSALPWHAHGEMKTEDGRLDLIGIREAANSFQTENLSEFIKNFQLPRKPGTKFSYSNVGMALLGFAAENATDNSFGHLIETRIAEPLEMTSTKVRLNEELKSRLVPGHWQNGEPSENIKMKAMAPAGQLFSTANDLLKFVAAYLEYTDSDMKSSFRSMQKIQHTGSPRFGTTASPWMTERIFQPAGSNLIGHGGGGLGYLAFVGMDTLKKRGVVVLSNQMAVHSSGVGWAILQQFPMTPYNLAFFVKPHVGVGFSIKPAPKTSEIFVSKVFSESPAEKVGLRNESLIKSINGTPTAGKSIGRCLKLMSGKRGDVVVFTVVPPGSDEEKTFEIVCGPFLTKTVRKAG